MKVINIIPDSMGGTFRTNCY
ncbi:MAG: hypothetical protein H6Q94_1130, partial [Nitrospirae bacterium]|nr:hypothetical protein [Nitrospirota bacterium]